MISLIDIGPALVAARHAAGLSQRDLGDALGVRQQQVARWERTGYRTASLANLARVAEALRPGAAGIAAETVAACGTATAPRLTVDVLALAAACEDNGVTELALFGSALRDDFRTDSDVDVLVTFAPHARPRLRDLARLRNALTGVFGRPVDVVERAAVERSDNAMRRAAILEGARVIYAA